jgi:thiamine-monophosphate kinase
MNLSENDLKQIEQRMHNPTPRGDLGMKLRDIASAALDISDGLLGDLQHILKQSQVSAEVFLDQLPKSTTLQKQSEDIQYQFSACGGDDYEICFTAPITKRNVIDEISKVLNLPLTRIGSITERVAAIEKLHLLIKNGDLLDDVKSAALLKSFDHFAK